MKRLMRLAVAWFGCIERAEVTLGSGLNVLYGPNDLGKSTLAAAIRAGLLLPARSSYANRYAPWRHDAEPEVELEFVDIEDRAWRVKKSFSSSGSAELIASRDGVTFAGDVVTAREVDDQLRKLLKLGIPSPGGKGAPRGLPDSFLAEVLLSDQTSVDAVLKGSLESDGEVGGRVRLAEALQAVGLDKSLKDALDHANAEVDKFFAESGKRRGGKASPYARHKQRIDELTRERDELVRQRDRALMAEELVAKRRDEHDAAARALEAAETCLSQCRSALEAWRAIDAAEALARDAAAVLAEIEARAAAVDARVGVLASLDGRARGCTTELEARTQARTAAEQALRLAEDDVRRAADDEAETRRELQRHELRAKLAELAARARDADARADALDGLRSATTALAAAEQVTRELGAAAARTEAEIAEDRAKQASTLDRRALLRDVDARARECRAATTSERAAEEASRGLAAREDARNLEAGATELEAKAPRDLPDRAARMEIQNLERALDRAEAALGGVGVTVTLRPQRPLALEAIVDSAPLPRAVITDATTLEATRTASITIGDIVVIDVAAGSEEARRVLEEARRDWAGKGAPVLARVGASSVADLSAACDAADEIAAQIAHKRGEAKRRIADAEQHEARASMLRESAARDAPGAPPTGDREALDRELTAIEARGHGALSNELGRVEKDLIAIAARLADNEREQAVSRDRLARGEVDVASTRAALHSARTNVGDVDPAAAERDLAEERDAIARTMVTAERALEAIDVGVSEAKKNAAAALTEARAKLEARLAAQRTAQAEVDEARAAAAREQGALDEARRAIAGDDRATARVAADAREADAETLPRPTGPRVDEAALREASTRRDDAARSVAFASTELATAEGASTTTGGAAAKERHAAIEEAYHVACEAERELELDADGWMLLRDTLRDVEREQGQHLGRALAGPLHARVEDLTHGRYQLDLGASLETHAIDGIRVADLDDALKALSVGTREQLATLLRVTIAESLGAAIMLDDHLVQSDVSRLSWFRDLLRKAAAKTQIIVFTCKPDDYVSGDDGDDMMRAINLAPLVKRIEQ
jgi:hypothetical protein